MSSKKLSEGHTLQLINALIMLLNLILKVLYFGNVSVLEAFFLRQTGNTRECPFCRHIEAFVLDLRKN